MYGPMRLHEVSLLNYQKTTNSTVNRNLAIVRPCVLDLSFIVTHVHQKLKALFCHINFDYYEKFC